jgi:hypothetical protein
MTRATSEADMRNMDQGDYQTAARRIVEALGPEMSAELLLLLEADDEVRADAFRQLYVRGGHELLLQALTDLEADPVMRGWLVEHLRLEIDSDA